MKLLYIDFETQSDDPATTNPTEVGALFCEVHPVEGDPLISHMTQIYQKYSQLIYEPHYPPQTPEIVELTGITDEMLKEKGLARSIVFGSGLAPLVSQADYVLAHNKAFDQVVYESTCKAIGHEVRRPKIDWICTIQDVPYSPKYKCKKLAHLAYDHGILVHPDTLHRAIEDVQLLARLMSYYPMEDVLRYKNTPWAYLRAMIPGPWTGPGGDGGIGKAQASKLGYSWEKARGTDQPVFTKAWVKRVKEDQVLAEMAKAPFKVVQIKSTKTESL